MTIPEGGFRLHWDDCEGMHLYQDFPNLAEALKHAAILYTHNQDTTFTRLENWLGEDACPPDQLPLVAKTRAELGLQQEALERTPGYASWS
jgi:hypothetical protein